jgi:hypothetical protein
MCKLKNKLISRKDLINRVETIGHLASPVGPFIVGIINEQPSDGTTDVLLAALVMEKDCRHCACYIKCVELSGKPENGENKRLDERTNCRELLEEFYLR